MNVKGYTPVQHHLARREILQMCLFRTLAILPTSRRPWYGQTLGRKTGTRKETSSVLRVVLTGLWRDIREDIGR